MNNNFMQSLMRKTIKRQSQAKQKKEAEQTAVRQQQEAIQHAAEVTRQKKEGRSSNSLISGESILSYLRALLG